MDLTVRLTNAILLLVIDAKTCSCHEGVVVIAHCRGGWVMRLYRIKTRFLGKDLDQYASLGHFLAENDDGIYDRINTAHKYGEWPESVGMTREAIIAAKGDYESDYMGEFYDQKFGWEDLGEVSAEEITHLKRFNVLAAE